MSEDRTGRSDEEESLPQGVSRQDVIISIEGVPTTVAYFSAKLELLIGDESVRAVLREALCAETLEAVLAASKSEDGNELVWSTTPGAFGSDALHQMMDPADQLARMRARAQPSFVTIQTSPNNIRYALDITGLLAETVTQDTQLRISVLEPNGPIHPVVVGTLLASGSLAPTDDHSSPQ